MSDTKNSVLPDIILKESIRFRADNKRAVLEKIELL